MREDLRLLRSPWLWALPITTIGLALLSVVAARYLPEIMDVLAPGIPVPSPSVGDVGIQWEKNLSQIFVLVAVAMAAGMPERGERLTYLNVHGFGSAHIWVGSALRFLLIAVSILIGTLAVLAGSQLAFGSAPDLWGLGVSTVVATMLLASITILAGTTLPLIATIALGFGFYLTASLASMNSWLSTWSPIGLLSGELHLVPVATGLLATTLITWWGGWRLKA